MPGFSEGAVAAALPAVPFVPYAGAVPDGGRHGQGGDIRRAPIV